MKRYHALDSLRASMMLLGIWLHTVVGFSREGGWPYKDAHPTDAYDWTLGLIHTFRMPLFFVMAGFFGALLWERGRGPFVRNRLNRILAPFALFWTCLFPVVIWMAAYSKNWSHPGGARRATSYILSGGFLRDLHPLHLWFLEYLLILYAIGYAVAALVEWAAGAPGIACVFATLNHWYRVVVANRWRWVIFAIPYAGALMMMRGGFLDDPPDFVPVPRIVFAYTIPFFFGWLLFRNRDLLDTFTRGAWKQTLAGLAVVAVWVVTVGPVSRRPEYWYWVKPSLAIAGSLVLWCMVFGLTGLYLRHGSRERRLGRYLADASYWMYIMHMPVVPWLGKLPMKEIKVPIVVALAFPVLVVTYDVMVRATWIGAFLNGRRYPRWFAARAPMALAATAAGLDASNGS